VTASAQAIYESLISDDFFINMSNGFSGLLDSINLVIDGLGGFKGLLAPIAFAITSLFKDKIT
jgi:hypothetical protein